MAITLKERREDAEMLRHQADVVLEELKKVDQFFDPMDIAAAAALANRINSEVHASFAAERRRMRRDMWRNIWRSFVNGLLLRPFKSRRFK